MQTQKIIICDMDETVANLNGRDYYDWATVINDTPINSVVELLKRYQHDHLIVFITGRSDICQQDTQKWLDMHNIPNHYLYMKPDGENTPSEIFKEAVYFELRTLMPNMVVTLAIDDRTKIINMWKEHNIPVLQVR